MPRTGLKPEDIRDKAIDATVAKIRELGFEKVRLTDIARELHVSHAALYSHFKDKSALLDAVSERWLLELDAKLDAICRKKKDPIAKIHEWALAIHRAKIEKVSRDPRLYEAFDMASEMSKPFVRDHIDNMVRQLSGLVAEAVEKAGLKNADVVMMTRIIMESTSAFHHPRLVAQNIQEKREKLMLKVLDSVLAGLELI
ncbi:MAG: TetR/AcrR family transcriptional regulator [Pyrinomonadaceae bacterium]